MERKMKLISPLEFTGTRAWDALDIERFTGATTVRLHWTDQAYVWHVNDGAEVFVVLKGAVDMHVRQTGREEVFSLSEGDIFHAEAGDEHVAHPRGAARVLVIETEGSV
jgi:mannose-6-phosphate isomerase-like protein (cupin superfamily)